MISPMRRLLAACFALALLTIAGCDADAPSGDRPDADTTELQQLKQDAAISTCVPGPGGGGLPDLTLPCLGGGPDINLASLRGPMLLNLWFSGCVPCRDEMPALQEFHERHGDAVPVLGIDLDIDPEAGLSFAAEVEATYPQVFDPGRTVFDHPEELRLGPAYPQSVLIDADGQVVGQQAGEFESVDEIEEFVSAQVALP